MRQDAEAVVRYTLWFSSCGLDIGKWIGPEAQPQDHGRGAEGGDCQQEWTREWWTTEAEGEIGSGHGQVRADDRANCGGEYHRTDGCATYVRDSEVGSRILTPGPCPSQSSSRPRFSGGSWAPQHKWHTIMAQNQRSWDQPQSDSITLQELP
jgi:hypothetical protein